MVSTARGVYRWRVAYGGRGSGKSFTFALMAAIFGYQSKVRILCVREFQNSIRESMHAEIKSAIESYDFLSAHYEVGRDFIRGRNGTEFIFRGLRHNFDSIKSLAQIDICICEEAEQIPDESWRVLIPTIRAEGSEIWVVFNPRRRDSWVAKNLLDNPPPRAMIEQVNYHDNSWFPSVLEEQRVHDMETLDPALYKHIWEGAFYEQSHAQVFAGRYALREFEPSYDWDGPYIGVDWGFSQDPTAAVRAWVHDGALYIDRELYAHRLELDDTAPALIAAIPDIERHVVRADNARPESISYVRRAGIKHIEACVKGKGSVEDGVEFIKSFRQIIIHPRCKNTANEFDLYSYKIDRLSGDVLPVLVDAHNHALDALRYALEPLMKRGSYSLKNL